MAGNTQAVSIAQARAQLAALLARGSTDPDVVAAIANLQALLVDANGGWDLGLYGAVGDGTTDDTTAINNAAAALNTAGGGVLTAQPGKTYKVTGAVDLKGKVRFDLRGSTLAFAITGDSTCLLLKDDCAVSNGMVSVTEASRVATDGKYSCPILVGDTLTNTGYKGWRISNVVVSSNRSNGNGILVTGASHDGIIENVRAAASALMGRLILVHWAGDGATPPALTTHPYDIQIRNVQAGAMTGAFTDQAAVFISAAYNITVDDVEIDQASAAGVQIVAGDYGAEYAGAAIKPLVHKGIHVRGVSVKLTNKYGVYVDTWEDNYGGAPIVSGPIVVEDCMVIGDNTDNAYGFRALKARDVLFRNCEATNCLNGILIDEGCQRIRVENGRVYANRRDGVVIHHAGTPPVDCAVIALESYGNGTDVDPSAGIYVGTSTRTRVERCVLGDATAEATQKRGIRVEDTAVDTWVVDNSVRTCKAAGVAYSLGSGTAYGCVYLFRGNNCAAGVATFRSGLNHVPVDRIPNASGGINQVLVTGSGAPAAGTWLQGDRTTDELPAAAGAIGSVCTTGGTPGTWKTYGAISA